MRCHTSFSFSLRLILLILVLGVVVDWSEAGRILRAWRQRNANRDGHGPRDRSPWAQFHTHRRSFHGGRRRLPPIHHLRQELAGAGAGGAKHPGAEEAAAFAAGAERRAFAGANGKVLGEASLLRPIDPSTAAASGLLSRNPEATPRQRNWPFINAIGRDPTFDYVPPSNEQVKFKTETQRRAGAGRPPGPPRPFRRRPPMRPRFRRPPPPNAPNRFQWNRRKTQYTRQPPLIWKLLASRRNRWRNFRRPPPRPRPNPNASKEAESVPYLPHIVFFQHSDMMHPKNSSDNMIEANSNSTITISSNSSMVLRPGKVTSVPLYPVQPSSPSEFIPIPSETPGKEYIFRVVELKHLKRPTVVPASTPGTQAPVYKSVPPPFEPLPTASTETITIMKEVADLNPPAPIENVQIDIDAQAEGSEHFLRVVSPPKTTTDSPTTTTTTLKPIFALREEPAYVEEIIVPRTSAEAKIKKPGFQHLLPTYNSNKKSTGLGTKKPISSKEYRESREDIGSSIMITGIRSKVKEYKPQLLANFSQLIAFDKVITPVVEVVAKPAKAKYGFSSRSGSDGESPASETTSVSTPDAASNGVGVNSSSEEIAAAAVVASPSQVAGEAANSTIRITSSSSESVSFSNSNDNSPSISSSSNADPDSDSNSESDSSFTTTSTESPMERFDPLKLIHSWFMKT